MLRAALWAAGLAAAILVILAVVGARTPQRSAQASARDAIALCRADQSRASLTPAEQRFVAGTCEAMEQRYTATYGTPP